MPVLPPASKVIRVDLTHSDGANTRVKDRFFLQYTGAGLVVADYTTLGNTISAAWLTNLAPQMSTIVSLTSVMLTDLSTPSSPQVIIAAARVGTRAGASLSAGIAAVLKEKINRRYRGGHPRIYLPAGVATDLATSVSWSAAFTGGLASAWAAFITAIQTTPPASFGAISPVNVSYFTGFTNKTFPSGRIRPVPTLRGVPSVDLIVSFTVNPNLASQRRRNQQSI